MYVKCFEFAKKKHYNRIGNFYKLLMFDKIIRTKYKDICFCVTFDPCCQSFISGKNAGG